MSQAELAGRSGLQPDQVKRLESGREWVERRRVWVVLAAALRVDPGELAGQPYPPTGSEHAEARAVAHRLRRVLTAVPQRSTGPAATVVDELDRLLASAVAADRAGDDYGLAVIAPELISAAERAARVASGTSQERIADLRSQGHAAVAGLLRRLGYRDLAWLVLHRGRASGGEAAAPARPLAAEEVRLLLDLGLPEQALDCVRRSGFARHSVEIAVLEAFAHTMAGRRERAVTELDAADDLAQDAGSRAVVTAARVTVAMEASDINAANEYAALLDLSELDPADRVASLVSLAASAALGGGSARAADHLLLAETTAPLRFRLDPFTRELLVALPPRLADREPAERLRAVAYRAGLP
jgi:transcriptional regulator with XRE-family HTH domain